MERKDLTITLTNGSTLVFTDDGRGDTWKGALDENNDRLYPLCDPAPGGVALPRPDAVATAPASGANYLGGETLS